MRLSQFVRVFPQVYASDTVIMLESGPGMGKTASVRDAVRALARTAGEPVGYVHLNLAGADEADIAGPAMPGHDEQGAFTVLLEPPMWPRLGRVEVTDGERWLPQSEISNVPRMGVLFVDEFGQAGSEKQKLLASVILERRRGEHRLPEGWLPLLASNRLKDKSGVVPLLSFLRNRISVVSVEADPDGLDAVWTRLGVAPLTRVFALRNPSVVWKEEVPIEQSAGYATPRTLVMADRVMQTFHGGMDITADMAEANEIVTGLLGEGDAAAYFAHLRVGAKLPPTKDVWANPDTAPLPDGLDAKYIMTMNLARTYETKKQFGAGLTYVCRMPPDLQVVYVRSATVTSAAGLGTPEFAKWAAANADLLSRILT